MAQNVNLTIDPGKLVKCGERMMQEAASFNKEVRNLYDVILVNLVKSWTGERATKFINDIKDFKQAYEDFGKLIDQLGQLIHAVGQDYVNFEKGN